MGRSRGGSGPGGAARLTGDPDCHRRKGLTFVSVHDCFWTHAADVEVMNQVPPALRPHPAPLRGQRVPLTPRPCLVAPGTRSLGPAVSPRVGGGTREAPPAPAPAPAPQAPVLPPDDAPCPQVCREQFVRLHSQPILHNLSRFLMKRFCSGARFSAPSPSAAGTTPPCPTGPHAHPALGLRSPQHLKSTRTGKLQDTLRSVPKTGRARHPARFLRAGGAGGVAQGPAARSPPGPLLHRGLRPEAGEALHLLLQLTLPRRPPCTIV